MTTPMADYQNILFPYAYNILGSAEDARDAIQDVLANYYAAPREAVTNEKAYLIRSVINQSINKKRRRKLVAPTDPWLPEPIATESADTNVYRKITLGSPAVAELLIHVYHTYLRKSTLRITTINHQPAFLFYNAQRLATCMVFDISPDGRHIMHINTVVDPEKLKGLVLP